MLTKTKRFWVTRSTIKEKYSKFPPSAAEPSVGRATQCGAQRLNVINGQNSITCHYSGKITFDLQFTPLNHDSRVTVRVVQEMSQVCRPLFLRNEQEIPPSVSLPAYAIGTGVKIVYDKNDYRKLSFKTHSQVLGSSIVLGILSVLFAFFCVIYLLSPPNLG